MFNFVIISQVIGWECYESVKWLAGKMVHSVVGKRCTCQHYYYSTPTGYAVLQIELLILC